VTTARPLLDGVSAYVIAALNSDRLVTRLERSLAALAMSRARVMAVADEERRRIERDLHDGAQQRLVALRIKLELLAERHVADSPAEAAELRALDRDIEATLDEVRRFGRGVYPPLLADRGLEDALRAVARVAALPTTVDVRLTRRYPTEVESAVYFCAAEALQNACKHGIGASAVKITAAGVDPLRFEVRDDGEGFDPDAVPAGSGLTNMRDRLGAVAGTLDVVSAPGAGTVVVGSIPCGPEQARAAARAAPPPLT
jgi:signal transduction histidine kinase